MKYFFILFFAIAFLACTEKVQPPVQNFNSSELPSQESWNSTIIFSDSGKTRAIMEVGHLRVFDLSKETLIDSNMKIDFYNNFEIKTTTLTAKRGTVNDQTKDLYAYENVVALNDSGVTLSTEKLMWRNSDQKIVTDEFVTILTSTEKIQGYGFESDQHLRNYVIYRITYVTNTNQK